VQNLRALVPLLVLAVFLFIAACAHLSSQANGRLQHARELEGKGELVEAIERYEWSIQSYTPFNRSTREAIRSLERLAEQAETKGDRKIARQAWQAIVSGLAVVHHFRQPFPEEMDRAERNLERLEQELSQKQISMTPPDRNSNSGNSYEQREASPC